MEKIIKKIAIIGAESTGKTALCKKLAEHYQTVFVEEYARTYFKNKLISNCNLLDIETIAKEQLILQKNAIRYASNFLFIDTSLITLKIWAELEFNSKINFIEEAIVNEKFDLVLITNNDIDWHKDELRENKFSRELIFDMNKKYCILSQYNYKIISPKKFSEVVTLIDSI